MSRIDQYYQYCKVRGVPLSAAFLCCCALTSGCLEGVTAPEEEPRLAVDTTSLRFGETLTEKSLVVSNGGGGRLDWNVRVEAGNTWCRVFPDAGTDGGTVSVSVSREGLPPGDHAVHLTIESNAGTIQVLALVTVPYTSGAIAVNVPLPE